MTAIAGCWTTGVGPEPAQACAAMLRAQSIYGPDDVGQVDQGEISVGRCLYRLLPEDDYDRQPLVASGGRLLLVADVRLDNRGELADGLGIGSAEIGEASDASLLLAAWARWSSRCFDRLVGPYAFAVWDRETRSLVLARDSSGERPLHFHRAGGFLAFSSMPKGLHALPDIPRAPNEAAVRDFLALMPEVGSQSYFAGVERVEPGAFVTVTDRGLISESHWPGTETRVRFRRDQDYVEAMREKLDLAVRACLRAAPGPIGAHLSGGLDSTAVASTAARFLAERGDRLTAFTAAPRLGFKSESPIGCFGDESGLARTVVTAYQNIDHVIVRTSGRSFTDNLDRDLFYYDRPLLNLCNFEWIHEIDKQSKARGIHVLLTGSNGNLSFSYGGLDALPELFGQGRFVLWMILARAIVRARTLHWQGVALRTLGPWIPGPAWAALGRMRGAPPTDILGYTALNPSCVPDLDRKQKLAALGLDEFDRPAKHTVASRISNLRFVDSGNYAKGALGGWGVDLRDPTSDRRLVEFCLSIPAEQFIIDGRPRSLARRALSDRLPKAVVDEKLRGYQAADWYETLTANRLAIAEEVARLEDFGPAARLIDLRRLKRLVTEWPSGGWARRDVLQPYRLALLRGLSAAHFLRHASGANV
jgi:asparagine synthase (glutamine-hydrolysing)